MTDDALVPLWFNCSQLPPSLCRKPRRGDDADDENSESERSTQQAEPPRKRPKNATIPDASLQTSAKPVTSSTSDSDSDGDCSLSSDQEMSDQDSDDSNDY